MSEMNFSKSHSIIGSVKPSRANTPEKEKKNIAV